MDLTIKEIDILEDLVNQELDSILTLKLKVIGFEKSRLIKLEELIASLESIKRKLDNIIDL